MVKEPGFCRGGNCLKVARNCPTIAWTGTARSAADTTIVVAQAYVATLERIDLQIEEDRRAQRRERLAPDVDAGGALDHKMDLDPLVTERQQVAVVAEVEEFLAGALRPCQESNAVWS